MVDLHQRLPATDSAAQLPGHSDSINTATFSRITLSGNHLKSNFLSFTTLTFSFSTRSLQYGGFYFWRLIKVFGELRCYCDLRLPFSTVQIVEPWRQGPYQRVCRAGYRSATHLLLFPPYPFPSSSWREFILSCCWCDRMRWARITKTILQTPMGNDGRWVKVIQLYMEYVTISTCDVIIYRESLIT